MVKVDTPANEYPPAAGRPRSGCPSRGAKAACRVIVAILLAVLAAGIITCCMGCETAAPGREAVRADIAWVLRIAYDVGGRDAVSNRIERLVARGKLTREQADCLHAAAQRAYERIIDDLDPADCDALTNALEGVTGAGGVECDGCTGGAPGGGTGASGADCGEATGEGTVCGGGDAPRIEPPSALATLGGYACDECCEYGGCCYPDGNEDAN